MDFQQMQSKYKIVPLESVDKPWEIVGANIFTLQNSYFLFIADYYTKFLVVKRAEGLSEEQLKVIDSVYLWCFVLKYIKYNSSASDNPLNWVNIFHPIHWNLFGSWLGETQDLNDFLP